MDSAEPAPLILATRHLLGDASAGTDIHFYLNSLCPIHSSQHDKTTPTPESVCGSGPSVAQLQAGHGGIFPGEAA